MNDDEVKVNINWKTDKVDSDIAKNLEEMKYSLLAMLVSNISDMDEKLKFDDIDTHIKYNNEIIHTSSGRNSNFSPGATIAALTRKKSPPFVIPDDIIEWMNGYILSVEDFDLYMNSFPKDTNKFELGRIFFDYLIENNYPSQSAYMLCAAFWVECNWNPNVYNKQEQKGNAASPGANTFSGCGEGLFQLTFWDPKLKYINKFNLDSTPHEMYQIEYPSLNVNKSLPTFQGLVTTDKTTYNREVQNSGYGHMYQLVETIWIDIFSEYLKSMNKAGDDEKSPFDYVMYSEKPKNQRDFEDDDHKLLYTGYLFKAAPGNAKTFENVVKTSEKYMNAHRTINAKSGGNGYSRVVNGFILQLLTAYAFSLYLNDVAVEDITLVDLFKDYDYKLSAYGGVSTGISEDTNNKRSFLFNLTHLFVPGSKTGSLTINPELFKRNPNGFDIQAACNHAQNNAHLASLHVCAKYVRQAINAGFRAAGFPGDLIKSGFNPKKDPEGTVQAPNWAINYADLLPTIGFKLVAVIPPGDQTFIPEPGDIAVYTKGNSLDVPGHICMYTGVQWCSDFKQRNMCVYNGKYTKPQSINIYRYI